MIDVQGYAARTAKSRLAPFTFRAALWAGTTC